MLGSNQIQRVGRSWFWLARAVLVDPRGLTFAQIDASIDGARPRPRVTSSCFARRAPRSVSCSTRVGCGASTRGFGRANRALRRALLRARCADRGSTGTERCDRREAGARSPRPRSTCVEHWRDRHRRAGGAPGRAARGWPPTALTCSLVFPLDLGGGAGAALGVPVRAAGELLGAARDRGHPAVGRGLEAPRVRAGRPPGGCGLTRAGSRVTLPRWRSHAGRGDRRALNEPPTPGGSLQRWRDSAPVAVIAGPSMEPYARRQPAALARLRAVRQLAAEAEHWSP
jgi:hypothetical protein